MRAVVCAGRAVLRGRAAGLHQASAYVLWTNDSGRMGAVDVQACGSSFAAVWSVGEEGSLRSTVNPFGKLRAGSLQSTVNPFGKLGPPKILGIGCATRVLPCLLFCRILLV